MRIGEGNSEEKDNKGRDQEKEKNPTTQAKKGELVNVAKV